jgi:arabinofuranosyltransferase
MRLKIDFRPPAVFTCLFIAIFLILTLWAVYQNSTQESLFVSLESMRSDFAAQTDRRAVNVDIIVPKNRFLAYGSYLTIPSGVYEAVFSVDSASPQPGEVEFQIASEKGRSILAFLAVKVEDFPSQYSLQFILQEEAEIEPRVLYRSGSTAAVVEKTTIERLKGTIPWQQILFRALFYAVILTFLVLSVYHSLKGSSKWKFYLACLLFFLGCFLILQRAWVSEDAFITLRHVDNFVAGDGPVFNVKERVEGFTHPLWFFIVSFFRWLGLSPKGAVILPGLVASFAALYVLFFRFRFSGVSDSHPLLNPGAAVLIGAGAFIDFGTSGLETGLSYLLLVLFAKYIAEDRWENQPLAMGLIAALLVLNRPDFAVFFIYLFCFYLYDLFKRKIPFSRVARYLVFPAILVGGYQVFRLGYYAAMFPNPFYAKSGSGSYFSQGFKYLLDLFQGSLLWAVLGLAILGILMNLRHGRIRNRSMIFFAGLVHGFFVVRGGGDFMHGRFLLPAFILFAASISGAFDRFFKKKALHSIYATTACLALFILSFNILPVQLKGTYYNHGISNERFAYYRDNIVPLKHLFTDTVILMWKNIGRNYRTLSGKTKLDIRIAYKNVGFTGYYAGKMVYVVDELGLTDPVVSRISITHRERPGHEKHAPLGYLIQRDLTFHETPFPLWNEIAETRFGILWDLSPGTLDRLSSVVADDYKSRLDSHVRDYLTGLEPGDLQSQADLLFFLKSIWYPHAADEDRELFDEKYQEDIIAQFSTSLRWIQDNKKQVERLLTRHQRPLNLKRFFNNIAFALKYDWKLEFSPEE